MDLVMKILLGIGNVLGCDDGVGNYVAGTFRADGWKTLDCGTAPENFTAVVRREHPELLVLIDAAEMGIPPGEFRIIPVERIRDVSIGTHQLPLTHLIHYLEDDVGEILFIGIQPLIVGDGTGISAEVLDGAELLMESLKNGTFREIPAL